MKKFIKKSLSFLLSSAIAFSALTYTVPTEKAHATLNTHSTDLELDSSHIIMLQMMQLLM